MIDLVAIDFAVSAVAETATVEVEVAAETSSAIVDSGPLNE